MELINIPGQPATCPNGESHISKQFTSSSNYLQFKANESTLDALFETLMVSTAAIIENVLQQNPAIVHARVWHGLTLLHKFCLRGDESLLALLLQHGADPNIGTDAGETPLHYACRKGRLPAVDILLRGGANCKAVDSTGHTCMHYAAQGGSIMIMVYLNEICCLEYDSLSSAQQTCLHVAAIHGHWRVAAYLLRKQRCPVEQADIMGNTALHLAAMNGRADICWQIISHGGSSLLIVTNSQKQMPLEMTKLEASFSHKDAQYWLKYFTDQYTKTNSVPMPTLRQRFNFVFPVTVACILPTFLCWIAAKYQLVIYVTALALMLRWLIQQDHRLRHPSRWPNPARAGVFAWGIAGNLVAYFYNLQPYHTMHWSVNWLAWTSLFVLILAFFAFFKVDPGKYIFEPTSVSQADGKQTRDWTCLVKGNTWANFCDECELIRTEGVSHCSMCQACYQGIDHHCLFLLWCVTASNARRFCILLLAVLAGCVMYISNVVLYLGQMTLQASDTSLTNFDAFWQLTIHNTLVVVMVIADLFGIGVSAILVHHYLGNKPRSHSQQRNKI